MFLSLRLCFRVDIVATKLAGNMHTHKHTVSSVSSQRPAWNLSVPPGRGPLTGGAAASSVGAVVRASGVAVVRVVVGDGGRHGAVAASVAV